MEYLSVVRDVVVAAHDADFSVVQTAMTIMALPVMIIVMILIPLISLVILDSIFDLLRRNLDVDD